MDIPLSAMATYHDCMSRYIDRPSIATSSSLYISIVMVEEGSSEGGENIYVFVNTIYSFSSAVGRVEVRSSEARRGGLTGACHAKQSI